MMDLFTELIQKMEHGGGITFDIDSPADVNEEAFHNTL
jgi:hypothetical protein